MSRLEDTTKEGKMLIQNLSKIDFQDKNLDDNILNLIIIYFFLLAICDRERERESIKKSCYINRLLAFERRRDTPFHTQVPIPAGTMQPNTSMADLVRINILYVKSRKTKVTPVDHLSLRRNRGNILWEYTTARPRHEP